MICYRLNLFWISFLRSYPVSTNSREAWQPAKAARTAPWSFSNSIPSISILWTFSIEFCSEWPFSANSGDWLGFGHFVCRQMFGGHSFYRHFPGCLTVLGWIRNLDGDYYGDTYLIWNLNWTYSIMICYCLNFQICFHSSYFSVFCRICFWAFDALGYPALTSSSVKSFAQCLAYGQLASCS